MGVNGNYSVPCVTDTFTSPHECFYSQQPHGFLSSDFAVFIVLGTEPKDSHVLGRQALSGSTIFLLLNFISLYCPGFEFTVAQAVNLYSPSASSVAEATDLHHSAWLLGSF